LSAGIKANVDGSAAIQVGGTDVITLTSGGAATFVTSPTTVQAGTAAAPSITFSGDTNTGIYSPGADTVGLTAGGTLVGSVGLGTTLALQGATSQSGTGITFPATQSASSNANTLDDYEEGTFTPSYGGTTTAGTTTYTLRDGYYTKVGRLVTFVINLGWSNATGTGAGLISGLPFTSSSASQNYTPVVIRSDGYAQAGGQIEGYVNINDTLIFLEQANLTTGATNQLAMDTVVGRIMIAGSYFVA